MFRRPVHVGLFGKAGIHRKCLLDPRIITRNKVKKLEYINIYNGKGAFKTQSTTLLPSIPRYRRMYSTERDEADESCKPLRKYSKNDVSNERRKKSSENQNMSLLDLYRSIKSHYPNDYIIALQNGDFYEFFDDDAKRAASIADIQLTKKVKLDDRLGVPYGKIEIPFAGFPLKSTDTFLPKFVKEGINVVLVNQFLPAVTGVESILAKKFERRVARVLTPGTLIEETLIEGSDNHFLLSVYIPALTEKINNIILTQKFFEHAEEINKIKIGLAWTDVSTGFLSTQQCTLLDLPHHIDRLLPKEIVCPIKKGPIKDYLQVLVQRRNIPLSIRELKSSTKSISKNFIARLLDSQNTISEPENDALLILIEYLKYTFVEQLPNLNYIKEPQIYMRLDSEAFKSLEIMKHASGSTKNSLFSHLDETCTTMGRRLLARRLQSPSVSLSTIEHHLDLIELFRKDRVFIEDIQVILKEFVDIERLLQRFQSNKISTGPKDLFTIRKTLRLVQDLKTRITRQLSLSDKSLNKLLNNILENLQDHTILLQLFEDALSDIYPLHRNDGALFNPDYFAKKIGTSIQEEQRFIATIDQQTQKLEEKYTRLTQDNTLKITGEYDDMVIEISAKNRTSLSFKEWRIFKYISGTKQKLRFDTLELADLRQQYCSSARSISEAESSLYEDLCNFMSTYMASLNTMTQTIAVIDLSASMAKLSLDRQYIRPLLVEEPVLHLEKGRHPVVEQLKTLNQLDYVDNDCFMQPETSRFLFITGPNMGGKSTFLRQVALITLMAQCGFYVPAQRAVIGLTDSIYTRIGAADNLVADQSTFMLEMKETAEILRKATRHSLVIMDEIGRGTSYNEGLSIAWGVIHYLYHHLGCRTLFATHYHDLFPKLMHLNALKPWKTTAYIKDQQLYFLPKLMPGLAERSFALEVAKEAGIPEEVLSFCREHVAKM